MAEEAMKARPVSVVNVVAGVDEFRDITMTDGQHPAGHEGTEQQEAGLGEVSLATDEQSLKVFGKMSHGRPSLAWEFGNKSSPNSAREADFLPSRKVRNANLGFCPFSRFVHDFFITEAGSPILRVCRNGDTTPSNAEKVLFRE